MSRALALVLLLLAAPSFAAECRMPIAPPIPDGETASDEEMRAAREKISAYVASGQAFITCLTVQIDAAPADTARSQKVEWTKQHNAAVDQMKATAAAFNRERERFNARPEPVAAPSPDPDGN